MFSQSIPSSSDMGRNWLGICNFRLWRESREGSQLAFHWCSSTQLSHSIFKTAARMIA